MTRGGARALLRPTALLGFLESLYRWDASDEEWLRGLCESMLALVPSGLWVQAYSYDASDGAFRRGPIATLQVPAKLSEYLRRYGAQFTPQAIARWYRASWVTTVRTHLQRLSPENEGDLAELERDSGTADIVIVNGLEPSGRSATFNVGVPHARRLSAADLQVLRRVASHLAAAARVRHRIFAAAPGTTVPTTGADAVFAAEGGGRLVHASNAAEARERRESLAHAVRLREAVRANGQNGEPLEAWQPLVDTRWTLVDTYEANGSRYIVARENRAEVSSLETLTGRERQVVAGLALGQTTKEIGYALGIDASTVRVLLQRAVAKLGVAGRDGLLDHPAVRAMRGGLGADELRMIRESEQGEG